MTCVHLLPQAKLEFKDSSIQHKNCLICCLKPPYLAMHKMIFVKRQKFSAATSKLHVEQNLVHQLGRILHFSQKVIAVTLTHRLRDRCKQYLLYIPQTIRKHMKFRRFKASFGKRKGKSNDACTCLPESMS